jgi:hypothetical protein
VKGSVAGVALTVRRVDDEKAFTFESQVEGAGGLPNRPLLEDREDLVLLDPRSETADNRRGIDASHGNPPVRKLDRPLVSGAPEEKLRKRLVNRDVSLVSRRVGVGKVVGNRVQPVLLSNHATRCGKNSTYHMVSIGSGGTGLRESGAVVGALQKRGVGAREGLGAPAAFR